MITGFNSDIDHGGKVFHVQTEEKGLDNPVVLTLVYCGGEIVTSLEASYADIVVEESAPEAELRRRMSVQHQELIRSIHRGKFTPTQMPYGHDIISDHSLDELVLGYLEESIAERTVKVGRVLNKLERFLTAAEQAQVDNETPAASAEVEAPVERVEVEDPVRAEQVAREISEATDVASDVAASTPERRRRKSGWLWAAVAAAVIVGATAWFAMGVWRDDPAGRAAVPLPPAPVVDSDAPPATQDLARQAAVAAVPSIPMQVEEPRTDATLEPPPVRPEEDHTPTVVPEPEETMVEEDTTPTPEPSMDPVLPEPEAQPEVEERVEEPVEADTPVVTLDDVDVSPMARQRDLPRYTRRARRLQQEGIVELRIQIDSHGDVVEVVVLSGIPDSDLNQAAAEVARDWTFSPARKDGRRVPVSKEVGFEFTVRPDRTTSVKIRE